jgi:hypothetical protein
MLIVDPWHWLAEDGSIPTSNSRLRTNVLKVARLIEYGGPLVRGQSRETLIECRRRPKGRLCGGLFSVAKLEDDALLAFCPECGSEQVLIHNWQGTRWAQGPAQPVRMSMARRDP